MWCFLTMWSLQNLPFNLARTLLAVFLISAIKSSSSCLTSGTNKCRLLTHTLIKLQHVPEFERQLLKDLHYSSRRPRQNKVTSWLTLLVHIQKILDSGDRLSWLRFLLFSSVSPGKSWDSTYDRPQRLPSTLLPKWLFLHHLSFSVTES